MTYTENEMEIKVILIMGQIINFSHVRKQLALGNKRGCMVPEKTLLSI